MRFSSLLAFLWTSYTELTHRGPSVQVAKFLVMLSHQVVFMKCVFQLFAFLNNLQVDFRVVSMFSSVLQHTESSHSYSGEPIELH